MRYLITTSVQPPAYTNWFDAENFFNSEVNMVVFDLLNDLYMDDGKTWKEIEFDSL